jgi:DNA-binding response OmpR family regulator
MSDQQVRVLIAEDEEHIAKLLLFKLKREGFLVSWASDGQKALTMARAEKWDLLILDVMMPHLDGWQVLQTLREEQNLIPVLMLTAKGTEKDLSRSVALGATRFLKKPFDPIELTHILREMAPDSEFQALQSEFIESLDTRKKALTLFLNQLQATGNASRDVTSEVRVVAHNIAGTAKTFGFPRLGELASQIDDQLAKVLEDETKQISSPALLASGEFLLQVLSAVYGSRKDYSEDLTSFEGSPAFEAMP